MRRIIKILLYSLAAFIALFAVAAIALYLFFDPNDFRDDISRTVRDQTGRELTIEGDISLQFFPWLAVEVGQSSLGNAPGFGDQPMASFSRASLSVRLLPAIVDQDVVIGGIDIESLQLNLIVDRSGNNNWSDLVSDENNTESGDADSSSGDVNINSIELINASINYNDAESGDRYAVDHANLKVGYLADDGSPVPVDAEFNFDVQPTDIAGALSIRATLSYDSSIAEVRLEGLSIEGTLEGVASVPSELQIETDKVVLNIEDSMAAFEPLDISVFDMDIKANVQPFSYAHELTAQASIEVAAFSPKGVMPLFDVQPPATADPGALTRVTLDAKAKLTTSAINLTDVSIELDDTSFTGTLSVPRSDNGFYQFNLVGDTMNLDRYMEPATEASGAPNSASTPVVIPADLIAPLKARGKIKLSSATLSGILLENVDFGVNASHGKMRVFPITADLFGGTYSGDVRVDASGSVPSLSMNEKIQNVDLASMAAAMFEQDNITGTISGNFVLSGKGADLDAVKRDLAGNMAFELKDGTYEGTDVWYELRRARAFLKQEEAPTPELPAQTAFSTVSMSGAVNNGVMRSNDLFAELPFLRLTGDGSVDLAAATVDYELEARVLERPDFLEDATEEELDEFTEAVIPLKVTGPIDSPSVKPDIEQILKNEFEDQVEDLLKDKLKELFD